MTHAHHSRTQSSAAPQQKGDGYKTLKSLWPYLWPQDRRDLKARVLIALVALLVTKLVTVAVPYTFKWATDALTGTPSSIGWGSVDVWIAAPLAMIGAYGVGRALMVLLAQVRDSLFAEVALHAVRKLASETFEHLHALSLRFHLERRTGGLSRVIDRGRSGIETIVRFTMLNTAPTIVELALIVAVLAYGFDWRYIVVILLTVTLYMWFTFAASEWRISIRRRMNDSDTDANSKAIDSLLNFETVKYFGNEQLESQRYGRSMNRYVDAAKQTYTSLAWLNAGQAIIFTIGLTVCMWLCAVDIAQKKATVGDLVMINALLIQLYQPLNFMGMVYREIKQGLVDIEAMFNLLHQAPEVTDRPDAVDLKITKGEIEFEDVIFGYDPARTILQGVSFKVPAGKTVAIVGASGAGKSTISRLLFRFYDVNSGRIRIDGQDIRTVTQRSLRASIGMVPQDTVLFNDTIRYNISYGRPAATEAEMKEAAQLAQISPFIEKLPQGYDSVVGERGLKLSGGEKQRVAIARTVLKAPPILILDEATSALDSHTEKDIQQALDKVSEGRTTIVIAHRLSTVVMADEILVLDNGQVAERGTHHELLKKQGAYAGLWQRQREAAEAREKLRAVGELKESTSE